MGLDGNIYIAGNTVSSDFPTTEGSYDTDNNGGSFISKLNSDLTKLLASTFLGGSGWDVSESIAIDVLDNIYVTGWTSSEDFPTTKNAYDTDSYNTDAFISKLDSALSKGKGGNNTNTAKINGSVVDTEDNPIESAKVKLKGKKTGKSETTYSGEDGYFKFEDLKADTYTITAKKKGYKNDKQTLVLDKGKDAEIEMNLKKKGFE